MASIGAQQSPPPPKRSKSSQSDEMPSITITSGDCKSYTIDKKNVQFALSISNKLLFHWRTNQVANQSYIKLVNSKIFDHAVKLKENNQRIENRLKEQSSRIAKQIRKTNGRKRGYLLDKSYHLVVMTEETECIKEVTQELVDAISTKEDQIKTLIKKMGELVDQDCPTPINKGKSIEDVLPRQARRKLDNFKGFVAKALWFSESFGLVPQSLMLHKARSGSPVTLDLRKQGQNNEIQMTSVSQIDFDIMHQVLYLLDRFAISDEAYHELRMCSKQSNHTTILPPLYRLKQTRQELNASLDITRMQGLYPGAFRPLLDALKREISQAISTNETSPIIVKISGDGARFSKTSNIILLSFSLPELQDSVLSGSGNHTFAALKAEETYDAIRSMTEVTETINSLICHPTIEINNETYTLDILLGSDYKFLLLTLGLNQAHSNYACVWCHIHKDQRWDMSVHFDTYNTTLKRTLKSIQQCSVLPSSRPAKERLGAQKTPILNVDPEKVVIDELHLLLRIGGVLIRNLVYEMVHADKRAKHNSTRPIQNQTNIQQLQLFVSVHCKVTFRVWEKRGPDGKPSGNYDWTSLMGSDMKKVLSTLPSKFTELLRPEIQEKTVRVWIDFMDVYKCISSFEPPSTDELHSKAKDWVRLFLSLGDTCEGFQKKMLHLICMLLCIMYQT